MPSGGVLRVGFQFAAPLGQVQRVQYIGNPDGEDTLILENRYAGPIALQWADSDIQVGTGLVGQPVGPNFHIPALSRVTIPWPKEYGANVQVMTFQVGATLFDNANTFPNFTNFRASDLRYWWLDARAQEFRVDPLYPEQNRILVARTGNVAQAGPHLAEIVVGGGQIASVGGVVPVTMIQGLGGQGGPQLLPQNTSPEARIMRFWVRVLQGSALLSDLEVTPIYDEDASGNSFYPFGSTAASTTEHNVAGPFPMAGAIGCIIDIDGAGAGTGLLTTRIYECAVPFD
jgi:hypothetical protein